MNESDRPSNAGGVRYVACSMRNRRFLLAVLSLGAAPLLAVPAPTPAAAASDPDVDFDGDGFGDFVVPVVGETVGTAAEAGAVHVFYGTSDGVTADGSQFWHQNSAGIRDDAEAGDRFGTDWAAGDFDGDGFDDLAIGVPGENSDAGLVNVLYGSTRGLAAQGNQIWWQDKPGVPGTSAALDGFGTALAAGDFDDDGRDDLAVGVPVDAPDGTTGARGGAVTILGGSTAGLAVTDSAVISQNSTGVIGDAEVGDTFGFALATGDIDNDGHADLAVGAPNEDFRAVDAGTVALFFGAPNGLLATANSQTLLQGERSLIEVSEASDNFGASLAIGRFDYGPYADVVVGVPGQTVNGAPDAGILIAVPGGADGLRIGRASQFHMGLDEVAGPLRGQVLFGDVIERADFDGNGRDDLVVGVWGFDRNLVSNVGAVITMYGGTSMFGGAIPSILVTQATGGVIDEPERNDSFGQYLAAVDANGDGQDGLFVGVPLEDLGAVADDGAGHVFGGGGFGLVPSSSTAWTQNLAGVADAAEVGDLFGGSGQL